MEMSHRRMWKVWKKTWCWRKPAFNNVKSLSLLILLNSTFEECEKLFIFRVCSTWCWKWKVLLFVKRVIFWYFDGCLFFSFFWYLLSKLVVDGCRLCAELASASFAFQLANQRLPPAGGHYYYTSIMKQILMRILVASYRLGAWNIHQNHCLG